MQRTSVGFFLRISVLAFMTLPAAAQWINHPAPGIPRTKNERADLSAPAPKTRDGKPDFSGIWSAPGFSTKYLENLAADGVDVPMLPWAAALYQERQRNEGKDRPSGHCLPHSVTDFDAHHMPKKVIQTPDVLVMLFESYHSFRQIFTDGRALPSELEPAWFGYSVGKWQGDTLVVDTVGIHEKTWLDDSGHPHSDALHVIERFRRID